MDQPLVSAIELVYMLVVSSIFLCDSEQAAMSDQKQRGATKQLGSREVKLDWQKNMSLSSSAQIIWLLLDLMEVAGII